jgi:hypothetical protein
MTETNKGAARLKRAFNKLFSYTRPPERPRRVRAVELANILIQDLRLIRKVEDALYCAGVEIEVEDGEDGPEVTVSLGDPKDLPYPKNVALVPPEPAPEAEQPEAPADAEVVDEGTESGDDAAPGEEETPTESVEDADSDPEEGSEDPVEEADEPRATTAKPKKKRGRPKKS